MIRKITPLILLLVCLTAACFAQASRQVPKTWPRGGYLEYLPEGYDPASPQLYPAIIFLHGAGELGDGSPQQLTRLLNNGPPKHINSNHRMCFTVDGVQECFIVLSPQSSRYDFKNLATPFAKWALTQYKIDPDRLFITGLSMGGKGCWEAAAEIGPDTTLFAGVAPIAAPGSSAQGTAAAARHLRVWAIQGADDASWNLAAAKVPLDAMVKLKADPAPKISVMYGTNHGQTYGRAYETGHTYFNPNVYEWFLSLNRLNPTPIAVTGTDKVITWPIDSVTLTVGAADTGVDGTLSHLYWYKKSGILPDPNDFQGYTTRNLKLTDLQPGQYNLITLAVDNEDNHSYDDVVLVVNQVPVVNAGDDKTLVLPTQATTLTATASDPGGSIKTYAWIKVSGGAVTMTNANKATVNLAGMAAGVYTFQITVTDNYGATATDQVQVSVTSANNSPIANAGPDQSVTLPADSLTVQGTASDSDGGIATYLWTRTSGPLATMTGTTTATLSLDDLLEGVYVFRLTVTDTQGATAYDEVQVTVNPAPAQPVVVFRVNNGGLELPDPELNWEMDKDPTSPSQYLDQTKKTYTTGANTWTGVNTTGAPNNVFGGNRYAITVDPLKFHFPTGNGQFKLRLYFAEKGGTGAINGPGQRVFDVVAENVLTFNDLDIYAEAGMAALKKEADVVVTDSVLDIEFVRNIFNPQVNGIEVILLSRVAGSGARTASVAETDATPSATIRGNKQSTPPTVFPNPVSAATQVRFNESPQGRLKFKVYNNLGATIREVTTEGNGAASFSLELPVESMGPGIYHLEIETVHGRNGVKLVKQ